MTEIEPRQIQQIQTICSKRYSDREARLEFFESFFGQEIKSTKDLTKRQASDLIYYLNTGKHPGYKSWAWVDYKDGTQGKIASLAQEYGWQTEKGYFDVEKLGAWINSKRCPVKGKAISEMSKPELEKVIKALQDMILTKKW